MSLDGRQFDGMWNGYDVLIIGGGSSVDDIDIDALRKNKKVIAVNYSIGCFNDADAGVFLDKIDSEDYNKFKLDTFDGFLIVKETTEYQDDRTFIFNPCSKRLSESVSDCVYSSGNSGIAALSAALLLTDCNVYLAGYDGTAIYGKSHYDDYEYLAGSSEVYKIEKIMNGLTQRWKVFEPEYHRIINLSSQSILPLPKGDYYAG